MAQAKFVTCIQLPVAPTSSHSVGRATSYRWEATHRSEANCSGSGREVQATGMKADMGASVQWMLERMRHTRSAGRSGFRTVPTATLHSRKRRVAMPNADRNGTACIVALRACEVA